MLEAKLEEKQLRQVTLSLPNYGPVKSYADMQAEAHISELILLNANENPLGPSPLAVTAIQKAAGNVNRYPDSASTVLRHKLAGKYGLAPENVVLSTGGDNILMTIAHTYLNEGDEVVLSQPAFFSYTSTSTIMGARLVYVPLHHFALDLKAMAAACNEKTKLVYLCNPNNPTGSLINQTELDLFLRELPQNCLVVLDEAYAEFVDDPTFPHASIYVKEGRPLLILRTFSKIYGLAGLRIGYCLGAQQWIAPLYRVVEMYPVNLLAQAAAEAALMDTDHVTRSFAAVQTGKTYLMQELTALGLNPLPSQANYIFVDVKKPVQQVAQALLAAGILIRSGESWGYPTCLRVSVGTAAENEAFITALRPILA